MAVLITKNKNFYKQQPRLALGGIRVVPIASFVSDMSIHCMNGQFLALIHRDLPSAFNGLVLMVEDT